MIKAFVHALCAAVWLVGAAWYGEPAGVRVVCALYFLYLLVEDVDALPRRNW